MIQEDASVGNQMLSSKFYAITAWTIPVFLIGLSRASRLRWPATTITAINSVITLLMMWILQLFPATAKLAPIYNPVTHMVIRRGTVRSCTFIAALCAINCGDRTMP